MLQVTFNEPIIIDAANLHSLLSLANAPAIVVTYNHGVAVAAEPVKRVRKPKVEAQAGADPQPAAEKAPRKRATKAEMEARKAAAAAAAGGDAPKDEVKQEAPKDEPKQEAAKEPAKRSRKTAEKKTEPSNASKTDATGPKAEALLERFAKLIDMDFGKASGLLEGFGVKRFSELDGKEYGAFDAKLTELGV